MKKNSIDYLFPPDDRCREHLLCLEVPAVEYCRLRAQPSILSAFSSIPGRERVAEVRSESYLPGLPSGPTV